MSNLVENKSYIDLPGQDAKNLLVGCANKVILRKHRDVVVDINLGNQAKYTLQATGKTQRDMFYDTKSKKLLNKLNFNDGERCHVWVGRNISAELRLLSNGKIIGKISVKQMDCTSGCSEDPKDKPAPIIISMKKDVEKSPVSSGGKGSKFSPDLHGKSLSGVHASSNSGAQHSVVQVVELKASNIPSELQQHFSQGGGGTGLSVLDPSHVATRNWLYGQVAGVAAYVSDNWEWLSASVDKKTYKGTQFVKAVFSRTKNGIRVYFSGYSNSNKIFGRGGFGTGNEKIVQMFSGAGNLKGSFSASWKAVAGTVKNNALISFIFASSLAYAEWRSDAKKDGYDLFSSIFVALLKSLVVALVASLVVAFCIVVWGVLMAGSLTVIAVGALTVAASIVVGYGIDVADGKLGKVVGGDKNTDGMAGYLSPLVRRAGEAISKNWDYLGEKLKSEYKEYSLGHVF